MKEHNVDLQTAFNLAGKHFERLVNQFQENKRLLSDTNPSTMEKLKGHIHGMECWVAGNLRWSFHSKRYFGVKHKEVMRTRVVELARSNKASCCMEVD